MLLIKTNCQKKLNRTLTKLNVLRELNKRNGLDQNEKLKDEYLRLEKGVKGEQDLISYLKEFGQEHWIILRNVWLEYFGEFEIDLLLITRAGLYAFEVKNYTGELELIDNQCIRNGTAIGHNPFSQTQKIAVNLENIFKKVTILPDVQSVLTFIGEHNHVRMHENTAGIQVVVRNQLRDFIWQIAQQERNYLGHPVDADSVLEALSPFEIGKASKEEAVPKEVKANARKGICCCHCGNFDVKINKTYIECACGMYEPREEAIVRTICEYGVIYHNKNLTTTELTDFFGGDVPYRTILRYLNKYFQKIGTYRNAEYLNKGCIFKQVRNEFRLELPKYLRLDP